MAKREKIIVALMVFVVIAGGYALLLPSPSETDFTVSDQGSEGLTTFVKDVIASLNKKNVLEASTYIAARSREEWTNVPFMRAAMPTKQEVESARVEKPALDASLSYSGYMMMGDHSLAIINGIEYEAGDELDFGGHIVKSISPKRVVVGPAGDAPNFILPLEENKTLEETNRLN